MGAYEFPTPASRVSYAWLQQYGLPTDGSADFIDTDGDGMDNWREWVCRTVPTDPHSVLRLVSVTPSASIVTVSWQSVAGVNYFVQRGSSLASTNNNWAASLVLLATNIPGQVGTTTCADTNSPGAGPCFYRVGVNGP
jgi:hypothetical protein